MGCDDTLSSKHTPTHHKNTHPVMKLSSTTHTQLPPAGSHMCTALMDITQYLAELTKVQH